MPVPAQTEVPPSLADAVGSEAAGSLTRSRETLRRGQAVLPLAGLCTGLAAQVLDAPELAFWAWTAPTLLVLASLVLEVVTSLMKGDVGLDLVALLPMGGAVALSQPLAGVVLSGAVNVGTPFSLMAERRASESTYAGIVRLVEAARERKAPMARMADRYGLAFLALTLVLAGGAWAATQDPLRALAVLVVATPCPLILAVPVALVSGLSRAAARGVLIKAPMPAATIASDLPRAARSDVTPLTVAGGPRRCLAIYAGLLIGLISLSNLAAPPSLAGPHHDHRVRGRSLAAQFCSECHLIGREPQANGLVGLPFLAIAVLPSTTGLSLSVFLHSHHQRMPSVRLDRDEMDAIIDYILSLKGREAQRF